MMGEQRCLKCQEWIEKKICDRCDIEVVQDRQVANAGLAAYKATKEYCRISMVKPLDISAWGNAQAEMQRLNRERDELMAQVLLERTK